MLYFSSKERLLEKELENKIYQKKLNIFYIL